MRHFLRIDVSMLLGCNTAGQETTSGSPRPAGISAVKQAKALLLAVALSRRARDGTVLISCGT